MASFCDCAVNCFTVGLVFRDAAELAMDRQSERTSGLPPFDDLPATVQAAFQGRTMLTAKELASLLEMDPDTLRRHIKNGDIKGRTKGTGRVRRHWVFTIADVANYLRRTEAPEVRRHYTLQGHYSVHQSRTGLPCCIERSPGHASIGGGHDERHRAPA
jgi:hypothetical protein